MDEQPEEANLRRKLQEKFDLRYVLTEGEYRLLKAAVLGACSLILTGFLSGLVYLVFKK